MLGKLKYMLLFTAADSLYWLHEHTAELNYKLIQLADKVDIQAGIQSAKNDKLM